MIKKIYDFKKLQTDRKITERSEIQRQINDIDEQIADTKQIILTTSVDKHGAISDFSILQIHKNTMNLHINKLEIMKKSLQLKENKIKNELNQLLKESEQFDHLVKEQKKLEFKKLLKKEEDEIAEYVQSKYIAG